jgi:hypothetical protein
MSTTKSGIVRFTVVEGVEGPSLYANDYRISGPKPWGGGSITHRFEVCPEEISCLLKGETMTTNEELADTLVQRLNQLISDPDVQEDIGNLSKIQVLASGGTANHPSIQVTPEGTLALVGLLNGICGTVQDGPNKGRGLITAVFTEQGSLLSFTRTKEG